MLATIRGVRESSGEVPFQERQGVHCHQASFCLALAYTNACSILEPIRGPLCASAHTSLCASRCHGSATAAVAITDVGRSVEPWRARVSPAAEEGAGEFRRRRRTPPRCCESSVQASRAAGAAMSAAARAVQRDPRQRKFARSCSRWLPRFRIGDARVGPRSVRPAGGSIRRPTLPGPYSSFGQRHRAHHLSDALAALGVMPTEAEVAGSRSSTSAAPRSVTGSSVGAEVLDPRRHAW